MAQLPQSDARATFVNRLASVENDPELTYAILLTGLEIDLPLYIDAFDSDKVGVSLDPETVEKLGPEVQELGNRVLRLTAFSTVHPAQLGRWLITPNKHLYSQDVQQQTPLSLLWGAVTHDRAILEPEARLTRVAEEQIRLRLP